MSDSTWSVVPQWRRIGTKLALIIAFTVVVLDLVLLYWDPMSSFGASDTALSWDEYEEWDEGMASGPNSWQSGLAYTLLYAIPQALVIYFAVRFLVARRLTRLCDQVVAGFEGASVRFDESGRDEVALLSRAMNELNARVRHNLDRLDRRDHRRREWIAQVSHDLRTPLAALSAELDGASKVCQRDIEGSAGAQVLEHLGASSRLSRRIGVIATDLLDVARLEAESEPRREPVPVRELIRRAVSTTAALGTEYGIVIESEVSESVDTIEADGHLLARALENLLMNALQHARSTVWVSVVTGPACIKFQVEDDGIGFVSPSDEVDFSELRRHRSRPDSAGLGLLVVQRVAEAHGGEVGAANRAGGGLVVWFTSALA